MEIFVSEKELPEKCAECIYYNNHKCLIDNDGYKWITQAPIQKNKLCPCKSLEQHDRELLAEFADKLAEYENLGTVKEFRDVKLAQVLLVPELQKENKELKHELEVYKKSFNMQLELIQELKQKSPETAAEVGERYKLLELIRRENKQLRKENEQLKKQQTKLAIEKLEELIREIKKDK